MIRRVITGLFVCIGLCSTAQNIDVQHYRYGIVLSDESDRIEGEAVVDLQFLQPAGQFSLDLVGQKGGKGMQVSAVEGAGVSRFEQKGNKVVVALKSRGAARECRRFTIRYSGVPADGLIISRNKYGDRTFFSDNWPNRARHWIPCNDQPSDKASVEFVVTAPSHYKVVSNGVQVGEIAAGKGKLLTHWKEEIPIPTKVMVIGAARFAVKQFTDSTSSVPVSAWVYPQNQEKGFYDYALATGILKFFEDYVGPYPYRKLANVQSKTIFGGMENASAIFYSENSVTGDRREEDLLAHEIAHQWFGNTATEKSFPHLWLSEGFATYLTNVYLEQKYGKDTLAKRLKDQRQKVIRFTWTTGAPVVDSTSDLMDLLNANSYEKGAWVLHMLRSEVGDSTFHSIIKTYYNQYKGGNAETSDFQRVAEKVSGKDLSGFFQQWLFQPGVPRVEVSWMVAGNELLVTAVQKQRMLYNFPLEIKVVDEKGGSETHVMPISKVMNTLPIPLKGKPVKVILDPNTRLLFDGKVVKR
ncbi:MAG TPA: M1 family aminopeptidase [Chitinophagaceae bacterium]